MKSFTSHQIALVAASALALATISQAILVQPYNYMLDDSSLINHHDQSGSLSPFYNDQSGSNEHNSDKDIVSIIGDSLARLRFARMLDHHHHQQQANDNNQASDNQAADQYSQEMAELIQSEKQKQKQDDSGDQQQSLSSSVANMILNVAQAAAASASEAENQRDQQASAGSDERPQMSSRGSIMELDTSAGSNSASSMPSKADLKVGPTQWFNPKETIPVLKISSMATPSKYKKVYFRSEKKLVDGAFHSPTGDQDEKKSLVKPFNSGVQRRSSRGTSSSVPPSILQDGVIDFIKKFRDVYVQTRPVGTASGASSATGLASSMMSAAASSPFAAILAPSSSGSRPSFASALSAATSMVNGAAMLSQAAANSSPSSSSSSSSSSTSSNSATGAALASAAGGAAAAAAGGNPSKSPISTQTYVSFWSKTFPTWVRKMLKQMRRRSLYNSSKRNQQKQHQAAAAGIGQKIASGAVSSIVESASSSGSSSSSSGSSSSQSSGSSSSSR